MTSHAGPAPMSPWEATVSQADAAGRAGDERNLVLQRLRGSHAVLRHGDVHGLGSSLVTHFLRVGPRFSSRDHAHAGAQTGNACWLRNP